MATLELGCGMKPALGAVHHDVTKHSPHVDVVHDLNVTPWPWSDESFDKIIAIDVFEHLKPWLIDIHEWLNECHRILKPGGMLCFRVPNYDSKDAYTNPTHYRVFTDQTFYFWDLSTKWGRDFGVWMYKEYNRWWKIELCEYQEGQLNLVMCKV